MAQKLLEQVKTGKDTKWNSEAASKHKQDGIRGNSPDYTNFIWMEDKNRIFLIDFKLTLLQIFPQSIYRLGAKLEIGCALWKVPISCR